MLVISRVLPGRWRDTVFIERFWRSLKYECVYLHAFETGTQARAEIGQWIRFYNERRPHSTHGTMTPNEAYENHGYRLSL